VPATGFAFGVERLTALLADTGAFERTALRSRQYRFNDASADVLAVPRRNPGTASGYLRAHAAADRRMRRVDVWVGDQTDEVTLHAYTAARGIREVVWC
jgi:hypothetical protein